MILHRAVLFAAMLAQAADLSAAEQDEQTKGPTPSQMQIELDLGCQAGEVQACLDLGEALGKRHWQTGEQTAQPANRAFERACELGACSGCLAAGDNERAVHTCVAPCESGDRVACHGLMSIHRYERATDSHPEQARRWAKRYLGLAQTACDGGEASACHELGVALTIGYPDVPIDQDAGRVAFSQAELGLEERCRADHAGACELLVAQHHYIDTQVRLHLLQIGNESQVQSTAALDYACRALRLDCAAGNLSSCQAVATPSCESRP